MAIQLRSISGPFSRPDIARKAVEALRHFESMGLLSGEPIEELNAQTFGRLAERVSKADIARSILAGLRSELEGKAVPERISSYLERLNEVLASTPVPRSEWPRVTDLFDVDQLSRLLGISPASVRRYRAATRSTPDEVAARLHFLAIVAGDLAGAYNEIGVRRWFERKRTALDGRSPAQILTGKWKPEDPEPAKIRELARSLVASPAT